jgi:hypothetical protein
MRLLSTTYFFKNKAVLTGMLCVLLLIAGSLKVIAQQKPPKPISVSFNPGAGLRFGAFFQSTSGGTVIVSPGGLRTFTGSVVGASLGVAYGAAEFDISADPGTRIAILNGPDATLYGSAGGTMTLHIGSSYPASPFVTTTTLPAQTAVMVGGTLTVGSPIANPSGTYTGSFLVTFIQE